jgi:hypothetical protein
VAWKRSGFNCDEPGTFRIPHFALRNPQPQSFRLADPFGTTLNLGRSTLNPPLEQQRLTTINWTVDQEKHFKKNADPVVSPPQHSMPESPSLQRSERDELIHEYNQPEHELITGFGGFVPQQRCARNGTRHRPAICSTCNDDSGTRQSPACARRLSAAVKEVDSFSA